MDIQCGNCNQTLEIEDQYANMAFDCPTCGANNVPESPQIATYSNIEVLEPIEQTNNISCPMCGEGIKSVAKKCKHCNEILDPLLRAQTPQQNQQVIINNTISNPEPKVQPKKRGVYIILALFLGGFGIHNFYAGYILTGLIQLVLTLTYFGAILVLFWIICDMLFTTKDGQGNKFA